MLIINKYACSPRPAGDGQIQGRMIRKEGTDIKKAPSTHVVTVLIANLVSPEARRKFKSTVCVCFIRDVLQDTLNVTYVSGEEKGSSTLWGRGGICIFFLLTLGG